VICTHGETRQTAIVSSVERDLVREALDWFSVGEGGELPPRLWAVFGLVVDFPMAASGGCRCWPGGEAGFGCVFL